ISDSKNHCLIKLNKAFGRTLTPEQVYSLCIKPFLGADPTYSVKLAQSYIIQLGRILNWYVEYGAKELTFCRSSLLLIHESLFSDDSRTDDDRTPKSSLSDGNKPDVTISSHEITSNHVDKGNTTAHTAVYLIDFVRWKAKTSTLVNDDDDDENGCGKDCWSCELTDGFRHGLETLIKLMKRVIDGDNTSETEH
ncbi:unnamed protein product, partial [Schistosoma turkestanicum]